ncbi:hypothetical protein ACH5RR_014492 [Cinchona calisaya]|uniref:Uncharacterized protein n=1 Tax=Cinchona calisaya TaxID=153742 RepID=A0ABD3A6E5_9GENT
MGYLVFRTHDLYHRESVALPSEVYSLSTICCCCFPFFFLGIFFVFGGREMGGILSSFFFFFGVLVFHLCISMEEKRESVSVEAMSLPAILPQFSLCISMNLFSRNRTKRLHFYPRRT